MKKILTAVIAALVVAAFVTALAFMLRHRSLPLEYRETVERWASEYGVPREIVFAVINNESKFKPNASSPVGAVGLMQLMPQTAAEMARRAGMELTSLEDPEQNIRLGTYYLAYLYRNTGGIWKNAVAAYNGGIGRVLGWLADAEYSPDGVELIVIPLDETRIYVQYVMHDAERYKELLEGS